MSRAIAAKFAFSLVALLILGQLQCVGACVSFFSSRTADQSLPPCHRHQDSKHSSDSSSDSCLHEIAAAGTVAQTVSLVLPQLAAIAIAIHVPIAHAPFHDPAITVAAPPGSSAPPVLRV